MNEKNAIAGSVSQSGWRVLMTRERWIEVGRIVLTGLIALLYWRQWVPIELLWGAVAIGLYPLVKNRPAPAAALTPHKPAAQWPGWQGLQSRPD